jgi:hypothetical protein
MNFSFVYMRFKDCKNSHFLALFHEFYCPIKSLTNKEKQGILKNQNQGPDVKSYSSL